MAITLPTGIRIAAGLVGSTIDRIGRLPQELPTLGVSLAGQAVRTSFRIRQELAELATRGDELLAGITGRAQEKPAWATFDEDDDDPASETTPVDTRTTPPVESPTAQSPTAKSPAAKSQAAKSQGAKSPGAKSPATRSASARTASTTAATGKAVAVPTNRIRPGRPAKADATVPGEGLPDEAVPDGVPTVISAPVSARRAPRVAAEPTPGASVRPAPTTTLHVPGTAEGTSAVTGDHLLSVAELKAELQDLDISEVRRLLLAEETGPNRAAYLTLLGNRLTTLDHENGQTKSR